MRRAKALKAACGAISWLFVSYLVFFVSDRLWETPPSLRILLLGAGLGTAILHGVLRLNRRMHPSQSKENPGPRGDRSSEAVILRRHWKTVLPPVAMLTLAMALLIILPEASRSTFMRWLLPMSQNPRFTFVRIEGLPGELVVARGEPFELRFGVACTSFWQPKRVSASFPGESLRKTKVHDGRANFEFAGQTEPRPLILQSGDCTLGLKIIPLARPQLKEIAALVSPPPSLQRPPMARPLNNGNLRVIEGSRIVLKGLASRSLKRAWLNGSTRLSVAGSMFLTEEFEVSKDEVMTFTWEDWHGLQVEEPMQITIVVHAVQSPEIAASNFGRSVTMQEGEILNLFAGDNHERKLIWLSFEPLRSWK